MKNELPGIAFEKLIADIQSKMDPNAEVQHNQKLVDRLGHERQFDVVFKGRVGGQPVLGVIECKDLNRKVGNPEVDSFVTKARDVNANVKVLISRSGFSKPALEKCRDYGVQPLMLVLDKKDRKLKIGNWFRAERVGFGLIHTQVIPCDGSVVSEFDVTQLKFEGRSIWEGLLALLHRDFAQFEIGWTRLTVSFSEPRLLFVDESRRVKCDGIVFQIEKKKEFFEHFAPWESEGFFDLNMKTATFPVGEPVIGAAVPTDLDLWEKRADESELREPCIAIMHYTYMLPKFEDAIDLENL